MRPSFTFVSSEAGASLECKLDTLAVRALDAAGTPDPTPATWAFKVKRAAPKPPGDKK